MAIWLFFTGVAALAALIISLAFNVAATASMLAFGPFAALGLGIAIYHLRKNPPLSVSDSDPVFTDSERHFEPEFVDEEEMDRAA